MLLSWKYSPSCWFRKIQTVNQFVHLRKLSTRCCRLPKCQQRFTARVLEQKCCSINALPTRTFMQFDPDERPSIKSRHVKDGICPQTYEMIYTADTLFWFRVGGIFLTASMVVAGITIIYLLYTDGAIQDKSLSNFQEWPYKYQISAFTLMVIPLIILAHKSLHVTPYRIYREVHFHGFNARYVAVMPHRLVLKRKVHFETTDYQEMEKVSNLLLRYLKMLTVGNARINNNNCLILPMMFVSPHYHNELNGDIW